MGLFDFISGKNRKSASEESTIAEKAPVNQILSQPSADPFDAYKDVFKSDNFKNASIQERMDAYQALENKMAAEQGRTPRSVAFDNESSMGFDEYGPKDYCGCYSPNNDCIHLNPYYISDVCAERGEQFDGMNTVVHEGRHAYHYDAMFGYINQPDKKYLLNKDAIEKSYNENVYGQAAAKSELTGLDNYNNIPCEQDTSSYANQVMQSDYFKSLYGQDDAYRNYVASEKFAKQARENWAYQDEAAQNLLAKNPELKEKHIANISSGMDPQQSMQNLFGGKENLQAGMYRETEALKAENPADKYAADYINKVSNESGNIPPSPTAAQYKTHIMGENDPKPVNYSSVSNENRNGSVPLDNKQSIQSAFSGSEKNDLNSSNAKREHIDTDNALTNSGKYKYTVETVPASSIDTSTAMGMDSPNFWNHHGNSKESYMALAEKLPEVQKEFNSGKSYDEIHSNPELRDCVSAYYAPDKMIQAQQAGSKYEFIDDGRHRLEAARELGCDVPVQNVDKPYIEKENSDSLKQSGEAANAENVNEEAVGNESGTGYSDKAITDYSAAYENSQAINQPNNYVDANDDDYAKSYVLGGSGNDYDSRQDLAEKDYYENYADIPTANNQNGLESDKTQQTDNDNAVNEYLAGYDAQNALEQSGKYVDSENEKENQSRLSEEADNEEQSAGQKPAQEQEQPETLDFENGEEQSAGQKPAQEQEQPETLDFEKGEEQSAGQKPAQEQEQPETLGSENSEEQSAGQKPAQEQEQPETLDFEKGEEQSAGQKPTQEQEQPEALGSENGEEQSNGRTPSQEEKEDKEKQLGGNESASDSSSDNSSSKSNDMKNDSNGSEYGDDAADSVRDNVQDQSGGMSM